MEREYMLHNHKTAPLSEFDMKYVVHIPPGGNWKNIPDSIEDKRLKSIRIGYANGKGSRSTYYGRLHPERPSYTISTYFTRPGNARYRWDDSNSILSCMQRIRGCADCSHVSQRRA